MAWRCSVGTRPTSRATLAARAATSPTWSARRSHGDARRRGSSSRARSASIHVGNAFGQLFTGQGQLGAHAGDGRARAVGRPGRASRGGLRVGLDRDPRRDGRARGRPLRRRARGRRRAETQRARRTCGAAPRRRRVGRARGPGGDATCGRTCSPGSPTSTPPLWPRRRAPPRHRRAEPRATRARTPTRRPATGSSRRASFTDDDAANPSVEGRVRRTDCGQVTDGGAGIVRRRRPVSPTAGPRRAAAAPRSSAGATARPAWRSQPKLAQRGDDPYVLPHVADDRRRVRPRRHHDVGELDGIEIHDCFTTTEYLAIDHFGLTAPGESWKAIDERRSAIGGRIPINPSGGLIGGGHPVGATGVRMALDAASRSPGRPGDYQVDGARTGRDAQHRRQHDDERELRVGSDRRPRDAWPSRCSAGALDAARRRRSPVSHRAVAAADRRVQRDR